jgi:hypothetical protein
MILDSSSLASGELIYRSSRATWRWIKSAKFESVSTPYSVNTRRRGRSDNRPCTRTSVSLNTHNPSNSHTVAHALLPIVIFSNFNAPRRFRSLSGRRSACRIESPFRSTLWTNNSRASPILVLTNQSGIASHSGISTESTESDAESSDTARRSRLAVPASHSIDDRTAATTAKASADTIAIVWAPVLNLALVDRGRSGSGRHTRRRGRRRGRFGDWGWARATMAADFTLLRSGILVAECGGYQGEHGIAKLTCRRNRLCNGFGRQEHLRIGQCRTGIVHPNRGSLEPFAGQQRHSRMASPKTAFTNGVPA